MSGSDLNRFRNQTICFRMSPDERRRLYARITISGMPKGQYCIHSLLDQKIEITVGKYQSDRLSVEIKRLREHLDTIGQEDHEELAGLLMDCKVLMEEFIKITSISSTDISPAEDFAAGGDEMSHADKERLL